MDELMSKMAVLRKTKLFKGLTLDVLQEMACRVQRRKMVNGEVIFKEGDQPHGFYVISSGEIILEKGGQRLTVLKENDFFGEMGLLSNNPRLATAISGHEGILLYLDNDTFNTFVVSYPEVLNVVIHKVIHDLEQGNEPKRFIKSHDFYESAIAMAEKILPHPQKIDSPEFEEKFLALRKVPLFKGLTDKALLPIVEMAAWKMAVKGEVIFSKGDEPDYMYIISKGSVVIKKGNEALTLLNGHDFFGEAGVVAGQPRLASAIAVEDSIFLQISKESFKNILSSYPSIAKSILFKIVSYHYPNHKEKNQDTLFEIENLIPEQDHTLDSQVFFESLGLNKSKAITVLELYRVLKKDHNYYITEGILHENKESDKNLPIQELGFPLVCNSPPKYLEVQGNWDDKEDSGDRLTGYGKFLLKEDHVNIPVVEATKEGLAYYGAHLIKADEMFKTLEEELPIWNVLIGEEYLKNYILTEKGGGLSFEIQEDKPHFHMPANKVAHGYYVLGKKISSLKDKRNLYRFTAFKIPYGQAVFTPKGVIHCDVALQGNWLIGCSNAKNFSSVVMKTAEDKIVNVHFELTTPLIQNTVFITIRSNS